MPVSMQKPDAGRVLRLEGVPRGPGSVPGSGSLREGSRVAFRVCTALPGGRYRIRVGDRLLIASSGLRLEEGIRYLGQVQVRRGFVEILVGRVVADGLGGLPVHRPGTWPSVRGLLRGLLSAGAVPKGWLYPGQTAEAIRLAVTNCGTFYEARILQALAKGEPPPVADDLKGFLLLALAGRESRRGLGETMASALRQIEIHQILSVQAAPDGPVPFWVPFPGQRILQGFARRVRSHSKGEIIIVMRVPFLSCEHVLVTLLWRSGLVEIHLAAGPGGYPLLRRAAARLQERLTGLGTWTGTVRVSRSVPEGLKEKIEGIRFVESYG